MPSPGQDAKILAPRQYADAWARMMVNIWQEKMEAYGVYDTGKLMKSFNDDFLKWGDDKDKGSIIHKFLQYGIYVERGTGKEKNYGNGGDIGEYRENGKERTFRVPKPWLSKKYLYSIFRLGNYFAAHYGNEFCRMIKNTLEEKSNG